jgi:mycothiol system anti-sigma-R factor
MNCRRVREAVFLYVDNEMEAELVVSFRDHLDLCPGCTRQIEYTLRLLSLVREHCRRATAPEQLRQRILVSFPHRKP